MTEDEIVAVNQTLVKITDDVATVAQKLRLLSEKMAPEGSEGWLLFFVEKAMPVTWFTYGFYGDCWLFRRASFTRV